MQYVQQSPISVKRGLLCHDSQTDEGGPIRSTVRACWGVMYTDRYKHINIDTEKVRCCHDSDSGSERESLSGAMRMAIREGGREGGRGGCFLVGDLYDKSEGDVMMFVYAGFSENHYCYYY